MNKKVFGISIIVVFIALMVYVAAGINLDLKYRNHEEVKINIGEKYNMGDIKTITNEVFGKQSIILEESGLYKEAINISVADATDDNINALKNKLNEKYNITQTIYIKINNEYAVEDVQAIAKEVFGKEDINVKKDEKDPTYVAIDVNLITEHEREILNNKINEKYNLDNDVSSISATNIITVSNIPRIRIVDMAMQYLLYTVIATILALVYFVLRFKKIGIKNVLIESIGLIVLAELLFISIITIIRLPINKLVILAAFAIYMIVFAYLNQKYIKNADKIKK